MVEMHCSQSCYCCVAEKGFNAPVIYFKLMGKTLGVVGILPSPYYLDLCGGVKSAMRFSSEDYLDRSTCPLKTNLL